MVLLDDGLRRAKVRFVAKVDIHPKNGIVIGVILIG